MTDKLSWQSSCGNPPLTPQRRCQGLTPRLGKLDVGECYFVCFLKRCRIYKMQSREFIPNRWQLTFDRDHNFGAVGGEDLCFVEVIGCDTHVGAAVFRRSSEDDR